MPATIPPFDWAPVEAEALELFRGLLRFDTTNPPGNELPAAEYLAASLRADGYDPQILESAPGRANLVVRAKGNGARPPLLLNAHLDTVLAEPDQWTHPPFAAEIHDGILWGRGTVDMKNMAAMSAMVLKLLARTGLPLERDVIFAAVADEENGCKFGSEWLVAEHPELVRAEYALGEVGGFSLSIGKVTYVPIMIAHKGVVWGTLKAHGEPGHGSMPRPDSALVKLAGAVERLGTTKLPQHECAPVREMVEALAAAQAFPTSTVLKGILNPALSGQVMKLLPNASTRRAFGALLSNTATPTVFRSGEKTNVIAGEATCEFDGRTLPGQSAEAFVEEVRRVVGPGIEVEPFDVAPAVEVPSDTPMFEALCAAVRRADPTFTPVPNVMPGYTDARAWMKLGTKHYGFAPVRLDAQHGLAFADLYHGHNERIPVEGFHWGLRVLWDTVSTFCAAR
jgi:acetylornithine deacetylase/succinyl-diaminopimelate desuccinylase-like protein